VHLDNQQIFRRRVTSDFPKGKNRLLKSLFVSEEAVNGLGTAASNGENSTFREEGTAYFKI
jgi:hypothetical protein